MAFRIASKISSETAGIRTTAMSKLLADNVPTRDSACREKLAAAGGVLLGKNATWGVRPRRTVMGHPIPAGAQSVGSHLLARRLVVGFGRRHRGGLRAGDARQRYRRLDPADRPPVRGIAGLKADLRPGQPARRPAQLLQPRSCRPAGLDNRRRGHPAASHCRPRSAGPASADVPIPDYTAALAGGVEGLSIGVPAGWLEDEVPHRADPRGLRGGARGVPRARRQRASGDAAAAAAVRRL